MVAAVLQAIAFSDNSAATAFQLGFEFATCEAEASGGRGARGGHGEESGPGEPGGEGPGGENCGLCFAAGTPVHSKHGDVPIEQIEIGEKVLSRNRSTGELEYREVTALTPAHQDMLVDLTIEGERDALRPSLSHPFWVKRGDSEAEWLSAGQIGLGDLVQATDQTWHRVVAVVPETTPQTVFNFTVAKDHDYFVGETGFLVHNIDCGCNPIFDRSNLHPDSVNPGNPRGLYEVPASGSYSGDRQALLNAAGIDNPGGGWAAHHVGYDPGTGMMTMQLVDAVVHGFFTHTGGVKHCGIPYVP